MPASNINVLDGENVAYKVGVAEYHGKSITYPAQPMPNFVQSLESLELFEPREDDIWILSYPKSGTHWIFEILGILLSGKLEPLDQYKLATTVELFNIAGIPQLFGRRCFNTHLRKEFLPKRVLNTSKVICIARNPKSTAVSFYKMNDSITFSTYEGTMNGFLTLFLNGIYDVYGSWFEHVTEYWQESRTKENMMFCFYEELTREPGKCIHQLSRFLGLDHSESFCDGVAKVASKENMRTERGKSEAQKQMYQGMYKDGKNKIVGEGKIDGWKNHLTVAQSERFDQSYEEKMKDYPDLKNKIQFS